MEITNEGFAIVERDTHLGKWVKEHGRLDFDTSALNTYKHYFKNNGVFLNVGANIGCYAFSFVNQAKEILCFEPNIEAFECLHYNLHKYKNVNLYNFAISDKDTGYEVRCENDNIGMAFIVESNNSEFQTKTIDSLKLEELDFILIDVEGFELKVLKGGEKTISKFNPIMIIEINDHTLSRVGIHRDDIFNWLKEHEYDFRNIYEGYDMSGDQLDIICFPKKN
jgi:FkbM family methyltransferase